MYDPKLHAVPPNCAYFKQFGGHTEFRTQDGWVAMSYVFQYANDKWLRGIVCAVAESAWRREAERLYNKAKGPHSEIREGLLMLAQTASDNATAWAELGQAK